MTKKAVRKVYCLDVTWTDCPKEVKDEVSVLWYENELGNDNYVLIDTIDGLMDKPGTDETIKYLRSQGVSDNEEVWIHYWW